MSDTRHDARRLIGNRFQFLYLCFDSTAFEVGHVTQRDRVVGYLLIGTMFVGVLALGIGGIASNVVNSRLPTIVSMCVVLAVVLLEGAYLEWARATLDRGRGVTLISGAGAATYNITGTVIILSPQGTGEQATSETS